MTGGNNGINASGGDDGFKITRQFSKPKQQVSNLKPKDLVGIPWRVAFALQADGWYLRQDLIWHKPNPMPESVTDRCTKAHEYIFLLSKNERYCYDADAVREPQVCDEAMFYAKLIKDDHKQVKHYGENSFARTKVGFQTATYNPDGRNRRSVWTVATEPFSGAHFACFPQELIRPCVLAGCPVGGIVLDPFAGSGTTGVVALGLDREFIGIELNETYCEMARQRITSDAPLFN